MLHNNPCFIKTKKILLFSKEVKYRASTLSLSLSLCRKLCKIISPNHTINVLRYTTYELFSPAISFRPCISNMYSLMAERLTHRVFKAYRNELAFH